MARIIDKEEKRCDIARASIDLFCDKGIAQTTIDEIARSAGVAKGTVYLYFKNKEEIIFAIWDMISQLHTQTFETKITQEMSAIEKILLFYNFSECEGINEHEKILHLYQHFVSSMLIDQTGLYTAYFESFFQEDYDFISQCLEEGVASGELVIDDIPTLSNMLIIIMKGMLVKAKANSLNFDAAQASLTAHLSFLLHQFKRKNV